MFELAQDFGEVNACVRFAAFGRLLRVPGVAPARCGRDEPILTQDRKSALHGHPGDLEPCGQVPDGPHMGTGLDVAAKDLLAQDVGCLLGLCTGVVFRDFSAGHAIERTGR